jgi:hypothetical protein
MSGDWTPAERRFLWGIASAFAVLGALVLLGLLA